MYKSSAVAETGDRFATIGMCLHQGIIPAKYFFTYDYRQFIRLNENSAPICFFVFAY